nr:heme NO-binding domain-containing protein [Kineococcus siccus]
MVNTAVADLARAVGGEDTWQAIRARAGVTEVAFVGMTGYPDEVTYRLVQAASEELGLTTEQVLVAFGRHWVTFTAAEGWGPLLQAAGGSVAEVLAGLDALHARISLMMPELRPPSFRCEPIDATSLVLHYYSDRPGLSAMVVGLVEGLGELLGQEATARQTRGTDDGADHDEFLVHHAPRPT